MDIQSPLTGDVDRGCKMTRDVSDMSPRQSLPLDLSCRINAIHFMSARLSFSDITAHRVLAFPGIVWIMVSLIYRAMVCNPISYKLDDLFNAKSGAC